ncbi:hypothetical protein HMPREF3213_00160 [Heyndrickxia coagulans]|uniref:Uncharacterized protein n=1 Tax=Heyndrickxia coagulans TaxID=1398 RepID=A0A133L2C4_HEYCO|nr:hypothetical protein HMPREF3213_00160 [Heyndrickxia coagulans]
MRIAAIKNAPSSTIKMIVTIKTQGFSPALRVKHCVASYIHQKDMNIILKTSASVKKRGDPSIKKLLPLLHFPPTG